MRVEEHTVCDECREYVRAAIDFGGTEACVACLLEAAKTVSAQLSSQAEVAEEALSGRKP